MAEGLDRTNLLCPIVKPFRHKAQCHQGYQTTFCMSGGPSAASQHPPLLGPWVFLKPFQWSLVSKQRQDVYFFYAGVLVYVTALCAVNYNKSRLSSII